MAEEEEKTEEGAAAEGEGEGGKKSKKKFFIIIGAVVVLLGGGGAGAYFMGYLDSFLGAKKAEGEHGEEGHGEEAAEGGDHGEEAAEGDHGEKGKGGASGAFIEIPTMIVNLSGEEDGTPRYLRLTVQLEMEKGSERTKVEAVIPRVVDQFQTYLRELRIRDLRGSAGIYRLQMELLSRVNQAAHPVKIKDVLFQEILIQ